MLMVKQEYINTKMLLRVKLRTSAGNFRRMFLIAGAYLLLSLVPNVVKILSGSGAGLTKHIVTDISLGLLFAAGLMAFLLMLMYRQYNDFLSVFPQSNTSRFASSMLLNHLVITAISVAALLIYLCQLGVYALLTVLREDVHLVLAVDFGFIAVGFLTFLMYCFLFLALFGLVGTILRKWPYYAHILFLLLIVIFFIYREQTFPGLVNLLGFLIKESSPPLFFAKSVGLLAVFTALSLVINYFTCYYKTQNKLSTPIIALICLTAVAVGLVAIMLTNTTAKSYTNGNGVTVEEVTDYIDPYQTILIDISKLSKSGSVKIEGENLIVLESGQIYQDNYSGSKLFVHGQGLQNTFLGNTITLRYLPPNYQVNGINLGPYINPAIDAYLQDTTLHINYSYDNAQVIILPIWGIAWQFDCYKDKPMTMPNPWVSGSGGHIGSVYITVE